MAVAPEIQAGGGPHPAGKAYLAVKQSTSGGTVQVFGPGPTQGVHLIKWREVH